MKKIIGIQVITPQRGNSMPAILSDKLLMLLREKKGLNARSNQKNLAPKEEQFDRPHTKDRQVCDSNNGGEQYKNIFLHNEIPETPKVSTKKKLIIPVDPVIQRGNQFVELLKSKGKHVIPVGHKYAEDGGVYTLVGKEKQVLEILNSIGFKCTLIRKEVASLLQAAPT